MTTTADWKGIPQQWLLSLQPPSITPAPQPSQQKPTRGATTTAADVPTPWSTTSTWLKVETLDAGDTKKSTSPSTAAPVVTSVQVATTLHPARAPVPQNDPTIRYGLDAQLQSFAGLLAGHLPRGNLDLVWNKTNGDRWQQERGGTLSRRTFANGALEFFTNEARAGIEAALSIIRGLRPSDALEFTFLDVLDNAWCHNDFAGLVKTCMLSNQHMQALGAHRYATGISIRLTHETFELAKAQYASPFVTAVRKSTSHTKNIWVKGEAVTGGANSRTARAW
jgi:hypothetical protein